MIDKFNVTHQETEEPHDAYHDGHCRLGPELEVFDRSCDWPISIEADEANVEDGGRAEQHVQRWVHLAPWKKYMGRIMNGYKFQSKHDLIGLVRVQMCDIHDLGQITHENGVYVCSTFNKSTQCMPNQIKKPFKHPSNQGQQKLGKLALRRQWSIFVGIKSNRSTPRNRSFDRSGPNWTIKMPSKMNLLCLALAMSALVAAAQAARGETTEEAQGSNEIKIDV